MRRAIAAFALLAHLALNEGAAMAQDARGMTLELPHPLTSGETAFVEVQVGPIGRGRTIEITTASGQPLGSVAALGGRPGQDAGTYPVPVPGEAIQNGRLSIRLAISQPGAPPRAPTADEVRSVKLGIAPAPR